MDDRGEVELVHAHLSIAAGCVMLFRHLRSFCAVADEGHVTRAAKRLNMAQPGLTQHIKALEEAVGVELIQRVGRGIELTPAGRFLHKEAEGLLEHVRTVFDRTQEFAGIRQKHIEVGVTGVVSLELAVTKRMDDFSQRFPEITVRNTVLEADQAVRLLKQKRIDVLFSYGSLPKDNSIRRRVLGPIAMALALPRLHRLANESSTTLRDVCAETLIVVSPSTATSVVQEKVRRMCENHRLNIPDISVTADLFSALSQVTSNSAVAIVPRSIQTLRTDAVRYLSLTDLPQSLLTLALYVRSTEQSQHVLEFACRP